MYVGTGSLGHYVTVAVSPRDDPVLKRVHIFDSLWDFCLSETPTSQQYKGHLARVGAAMLGRESTEKVTLIWHKVPQQAVGGTAVGPLLCCSLLL